MPTLVVASPAYAGTQTGTADATIVASLTLVNTKALNFGTIIPTSAPGSVTISPLGARTANGGALPTGGAFNAAEFAGQGARRNQQITISFGASSTLITRVGGTQTMVVDTFSLGNPPSASLANVAAGARFRIVPANAIFDFPVGATLRVAANQATGSYVGTFSVTANYN